MNWVGRDRGASVAPAVTPGGSCKGVSPIERACLRSGKLGRVAQRSGSLAVLQICRRGVEVPTFRV